MKTGLSGSSLFSLFNQVVTLSQESVEWITGKIVLDARFREALLAAPDQTLSGFELTEREKAGLRCLDSETMEALAQTLAIRLSKIRPASRDALQIFYRNKNKEE